MTDLALARKKACLATVQTVLADLVDDADLIKGALRVADFLVDDLEGRIGETDAILLAVTALTRVNRAMRAWSDADGNAINALSAAKFVIDEQMMDSSAH